MAPSEGTGMTQYPDISIEDIIIELKDWAKAIKSTRKLLSSNKGKIKKSKLWEEINPDLKCAIQTFIEFYDRSIQEITKIKGGISKKVIPEHVARIHRLAHNGFKLYYEHREVWARPYNVNIIGTKDFQLGEKLYKKARTMNVNMRYLRDLAARLNNFVENKNNSKQKVSIVREATKDENVDTKKIKKNQVKKIIWKKEKKRLVKFLRLKSHCLQVDLDDNEVDKVISEHFKLKRISNESYMPSKKIPCTCSQATLAGIFKKFHDHKDIDFNECLEELSKLISAHFVRRDIKGKKYKNIDYKKFHSAIRQGTTKIIKEIYEKIMQGK